MAASNSLLEWILELFRDPEARAQFQADPDRYAAEHGIATVTAADVHDALCVAADDERAHSSHGGGNDHDSHRHHSAPREVHHDDHPVRYLHEYVTNNYTTVEEHNTNIDDSVHQNIDTGGGDFHQVIDNDPVVASGAGSVATGGSIDGSTVTSGNANVIGDGNHAATGDGNTTSFGSGSANASDVSHTSFGDGSGTSVGGDAWGQSTDNATTTLAHNSGSGDTSVNAAGAHGYSDGYTDQAQHDNSTHSNYEDSSHSSEHNTYGSHNADHYTDSHDSDLHHA